MHLLKHFHKLSIYPKNANTLKVLVLQLAIQGKLTAEWRVKNNEHKADNKLLGRIKDYNKKQLKEKNRRVKKPKIVDEVDIEIPSTWICVNNYELFTLQKGKNPKDLTERVQKYSYLDIKALDKGVVRRYSNDEKAIQCTDDDILVVCDGSRSGLVLDGKDGIVGSTLAIIETPPFIQEYIKLIFLEDFQRANSNLKGAAIPHLDIKALLARKIGLPPLEEQKEIVRVVEILFKEVEQLETLTQERIQLKRDYVISALNQLATQNTQTAWQELSLHFSSFFDDVTNIKKLRETILQLAVQGKLTADWRIRHPEFVSGSHHASELLKSIQQEKAQLVKEKKIKKEKALPAITPEEIPYELPEGWVWCRIRDVSYSIVPNRDKPKSFSGDITWLTTRNLEKQSSEIHEKKTDNKLTMAEVELYNARLLPPNSVIMSCVGQFGLSAILDKEYSCNQQLHCFVPLCDVNPYYLDFLIKNGKDIYEHMSSATTIAYLNKTKCDSLPISIPPLEEQKAIVEKVNALMGLCDSLEQEVQTGEQQLEDLMQSVLREVFEGRQENKQDTLPMAAEPEGVYEKSTFDEIFESLNYDYEVAAVVLLTQERFGFTYGKKYIHKMFSNIDFLNELPVFKDLQFQENGWGMYSPIIHKTLENEVFVTYKSLSANKKALQVKPKAIPKINKWINARENGQFINQVKQMLTIYEQPLIDRNMDRIELLNTVLECITVLKTDLLKDIRSKMKNWKMFEGNYKTKAEKFSENETLHMIHFIKGLKQTNQYMTYKHNTNN